MSDPWVKKVQIWLNATYGHLLTDNKATGWTQVAEDGITGWQTMYGLTKALQYELGITALSTNYGAGTTTAVANHGAITPSESNQNIISIMIGGLYCKGYNAANGSMDGYWGDQMWSGVIQLQTDSGVPLSGVIEPKLVKAILNLDAYVKLASGQDNIREAQQWMNNQFYNASWFNVIPADGCYSRDVQTMLVYALQTELNVSGANGNFGNGTRSAIGAKGPISIGDTDTSGHRWVKLFQTALRFNNVACGFDGTFSASDSAATTKFQKFTVLPQTGQGDYPTWCSLLVSNGDTTRKGAAGECATTITPEFAQSLLKSGRKIVGRYLTNATGMNLDKCIKTGELGTIISSGLRVFPIFETWGNTVNYFGDAQGYSDGQEAINAAQLHGFPPGTVIYYAVDCDPTGDQITSQVIPYFQGVNRVMAEHGGPFQIGVYGTRNVCCQLAAKRLARRSFVAGMSSGYSGNLGFQLPPNWAFDQISTVRVSPDGTEVISDSTSLPAGWIEIDNDIAYYFTDAEQHFRDPGQNFVAGLSWASDDPYSHQDPAACGLANGAHTPWNLDGTQIMAFQMENCQGTVPKCYVEVRYNKGYCWIRYDGGNGTPHGLAYVRLLVDGESILNTDHDQQGDQNGKPESMTSCWSVCSSKCGGAVVAVEIWDVGAGQVYNWQPYGQFVAA